ncbi:MAG: hypothetical protein HY911_13640 [Desulfobacterales bacterium]|nr:hypothetical protein [Desulfobacterales bacterium]
MISRTTAFLLWAAVLVCAALFFLGDGQYGVRSLNRLWDLGHIPAFGLFAYMLVSRWKKLATSRLGTQLLVVLGAMALLGLGIELIQLRIGRMFSWLDLRKNMIGAALGLFCCAPAAKELPKALHWGLKFVLIGLVLWEAAPVGRALFDEIVAGRQFPLLSGLETPFERERWSGDAQYFVQRRVYSQGRASLGVALGTEMYSGVSLNYFPRDWRGFTFLSIDVFNPEPEPIDLTCRVNDTEHNRRGYHYTDRFNRTYRFEPGWRTITIALEEIRNAPEQRPMQMEQIDNFAIFAVRLARPRTIYIDNVRLVP